jgi:hypothetical protein
MHGEHGRLARFRWRPADGFINNTSMTPHQGGLNKAALQMLTNVFGGTPALPGNGHNGKRPVLSWDEA